MGPGVVIKLPRQAPFRGEWQPSAGDGETSWRRVPDESGGLGILLRFGFGEVWKQRPSHGGARRLQSVVGLRGEKSRGTLNPWQARQFAKSDLRVRRDGPGDYYFDEKDGSIYRKEDDPRFHAFVAANDPSIRRGRP